MNFVGLEQGPIIHAGLALHPIQIARYISGETLRTDRPGDRHLYLASVLYVEVYRGGRLKWG